MNNSQQTIRVGLFFLLGVALAWITFESLSGGQIFKKKGYTLIALELYWSKNRVKVAVGLAKGKKQHDKRDTEKDRDWQRDKARALKAR